MSGGIALYAAQSNTQIDTEIVEKSGFQTETNSCSSGNSGWVQCPFMIWKPAIFRKVKEIKYLSGSVALYAAQSNTQIDAEIVEKSGFQTETNYNIYI